MLKQDYKVLDFLPLKYINVYDYLEFYAKQCQTTFIESLNYSILNTGKTI